MNIAAGAVEAVDRPALRVLGMFGIGDCIHQRAVIRDLMRDADVTLETYYSAMYHDLVGKGLQIVRCGGPTRRIRDAGVFRGPPARVNAIRKKLTYSPQTIRQHGSILAAQFASVGLKMSERPDFSMPVPDAWKRRAFDVLNKCAPSRKPLLMYRPPCLNRVWPCPSRCPDTAAYAALFKAIRDEFFVVSFADLSQREWIEGEPQSADLTVHHGELDFETLAGMMSIALLAFVCPGFSPVLAQAVGTPVVIVYGGNESARTTNSVGDHLAPTLHIEADRPCECHSQHHACDKRITLEPAFDRLAEFVKAHAR